MENQASKSAYRAVAAISATLFAIMTILFFVFVYFDQIHAPAGSADMETETVEVMEPEAETAEADHDAPAAETESADHSESTY